VTLDIPPGAPTHVSGWRGAGGQVDPDDLRVLVTRAPAAVLSRANERFLLDDQELMWFGLRAANVLQSDEITAGFIDQMDAMLAHGMQQFSLTMQGGRGTEGGNSLFDAYNADGSIKAAYEARLHALMEASASKGMVPVIVCFYRGRDQDLTDADAVRDALVNTMESVAAWKHWWLNAINEPGHGGFDHSILTTEAGQVELYQLAKATDPDRIVYVSEASGANDGFLSDTWGRNGIGSSMPAGSVSIEESRRDAYTNPGEFTGDAITSMLNRRATAFAIPAYFFLHAAWHQKADAESWPRWDKGGAGSEQDPGVAFAWDEQADLQFGED
jgi:hypothetical protein